MYVCICNAITEKQIRAAARDGVSDLWGLQAELGVATNCGSCKEVASEILAEYRVGSRRARQGRAARDTLTQPQIYTPALA
jgi:bacterioferritin-associated ferredoxin